MVKNLRLPASADEMLKFTNSNDSLFKTYYELFVFGASYGRHYRVLDNININKLVIKTGQIKDPISFSFFRTEGYDEPLAIILFSHFEGDLKRFKDEKECKQVLEAYAQQGLEKFVDDIKEKYMNTTAVDVANFYHEVVLA